MQNMVLAFWGPVTLVWKPLLILIGVLTVAFLSLPWGDDTQFDTDYFIFKWVEAKHRKPVAIVLRRGLLNTSFEAVHFCFREPWKWKTIEHQDVPEEHVLNHCEPISASRLDLGPLGIDPLDIDCSNAMRSALALL